MDQPLDIRLVIQISERERDLIADYQFGQRINGRSEAVRRILAAGFASLGIETAPLEGPARAIDDLPAPIIPEPADCGRPVLGELVLPWLREQGRREYNLQDVLVGAFGIDGAHVVGRDAAVRKVFKAIGWQEHSSRSGGVTKRTFTAPVA